MVEKPICPNLHVCVFEDGWWNEGHRRVASTEAQRGCAAFLRFRFLTKVMREGVRQGAGRVRGFRARA